MFYEHVYFERSYPYTLGLIAGAVWCWAEITLPSERDILGSTLTISAILTGFLATSKALLMSIGSETMKQIKTSGYSSNLISYFGEATAFCFITCLISLLGYFIDIQTKWFGVLWIISGVVSVFCFVRITYITLKILSK